MMRGLAIIIGSAAHDRLHAALSLAAAAAALGRDVAVYFHADAASVADPAMRWDEDARFAAAGAPTIGELLESTLELGAVFTVCQTGLALADLAAIEIDPRLEPGGLVDFLGRAGDSEITLG